MQKIYTVTKIALTFVTGLNLESVNGFLFFDTRFYFLALKAKSSFTFLFRKCKQLKQFDFIIFKPNVLLMISRHENNT